MKQMQQQQRLLAARGPAPRSCRQEAVFGTRRGRVPAWSSEPCQPRPDVAWPLVSNAAAYARAGVLPAAACARNAETVPAARACDCCSTHQPRPGPVLQLTPVLRPYPRSPLGDGAAAHPRQAPPLDRASLHPGAGQQRLHPVMRGIQHASTTPAAAAACRLPTQACAPLDPAIPPPILRPDPQGPLPWSSHTRCSRCHSAPCRVIFGSREGVSARPLPEGGGPELAGSRGSPPALQGSPSFGCNAPSLSHILRSFLRTNRPKLRRCCCLRGFTPGVTNDSHAPAQLPGHPDVPCCRAVRKTQVRGMAAGWCCPAGPPGRPSGALAWHTGAMPAPVRSGRTAADQASRNSCVPPHSTEGCTGCVTPQPTRQTRLSCPLTAQRAARGVPQQACRSRRVAAAAHCEGAGEARQALGAAGSAQPRLRGTRPTTLQRSGCRRTARRQSSLPTLGLPIGVQQRTLLRSQGAAAALGPLPLQVRVAPRILQRGVGVGWGGMVDGQAERAFGGALHAPLRRCGDDAPAQRPVPRPSPPLFPPHQHTNTHTYTHPRTHAPTHISSPAGAPLLTSRTRTVTACPS